MNAGLTHCEIEINDYVRQDILIGIVTYNPDISQLKSTIRKIPDDGFCCIIVDNSSGNLCSIRQLLDGNVHMIENPNNYGIAKALNQIMEYGKDLGYEWVLLLDQDSDYPFDKFRVMANMCNNENAIISPGIYDRKGECFVLTDPGSGVRSIEKCITSGSLTQIKAWERVGGFDENLFIDGVDFDFCKRIRGAGYRIIQNADIIMTHEIGDYRIKRIFLWRIKYNWHTAGRTYYIVRNMVYMERKYRDRNYLLLRLIKRLLEILLLYDQKRLRLRYFCEALKDGRALRLPQI